VDLTRDDDPSGAQPRASSPPPMAPARLSNTCPAVQGSVSSPRTTTPADPMTVEEDWADDEVDWDFVAAIEASRDRAAGRMTVEGDWWDDEVDWGDVEAIEAEHLQGRMPGVAIDVDGMEGTLHD
jgi:hypothetical protein